MQTVYLVAKYDEATFSVIGIFGDKDYAIQTMEDAYSDQRSDIGDRLHGNHIFLLDTFGVFAYQLDTMIKGEQVAEIDPHEREAS